MIKGCESDELFEDDNRNEKCRKVLINLSDADIKKTKDLINILERKCICDSMDLKKIKIDKHSNTAMLTFYTIAQAREAAWKMERTVSSLKPSMVKNRQYCALLSLCVEGNPCDLKEPWKLEPCQKIVERWSSPVWVTSVFDGNNNDQIRISLVESKKRKLEVSNHQKKYDTDWTLHLPVKAIHDIQCIEPGTEKNHAQAIKIRLDYPPDVLRWTVKYDWVHKQAERIYNWKPPDIRFRCNECKELNDDSEQCQGCLSWMGLYRESPGAICPKVACTDKSCILHPMRDLFKGNESCTWINPLSRASFLKGKKTLVNWKLHCRTFDEPPTHLLQNIGECWVWVLNFHDGQPVEKFKTMMKSKKVSFNPRTTVSEWFEERVLPLNSSNMLVQRKYKHVVAITYSIGIRLWPADTHWPHARTMLNKYLLDGSKSLLRYQDGINRFNQVYGLQSLMACFPAPIIREELLDPNTEYCWDPGHSQKNRFSTDLEFTKGEEGGKGVIEPDYYMHACRSMRNRFDDNTKKYDEWRKRHWCHNSEKEVRARQRKCAITNKLLGNHPESVLQRCRDAYNMYNYKSDMNKTSSKENLREKKVWVKDIYVSPTRIDFKVKADENCRLFREELASKDYCARVHLQADFLPGKSHRRPHFWAEGAGFNVAAKIFMDNSPGGCGIPMFGGFCFHHLCYSDKQVKASTYWAYAQLGKHVKMADSIACKPKPETALDVMSSLSIWRQIKTVGKKMARAALYFSGGCGVGQLIEDSRVAFVNDRMAKDGKALTDGCGLILESYVKNNIERYRSRKNIAMIQAKYKGCKGMWVVVNKEVFKEVISEDRRRGEKEDKSPSCVEVNDLIMILPRSMKKFQTRINIAPELEIKCTLGAKCCKTNRELIGCLEAHGVTFEVIRKYAVQMQKLLNRILQNDTKAALIFLEECRDYARLNQLKNNNFWGEKGRREFWDNLKLTTDPKSIPANYADLKKRFKIMLRYPSVRMRAVADWTGTLGPGEIFLKTEVLEFSPLENHTNFRWTCTRCLGSVAASEKKVCPTCKAGRRCSAKDHQVYEGDVGLLKNPCLHPTSYIRAKAVYSRKLDRLFPNAEVFLFCGREGAEFCLVNKLSGGDLDGDDFLVITQEDLLPMEKFDKCPELVYDEEEPEKVKDIPTNMDCVNFFVDYPNADKVAVISNYHEAWSNMKGGILNEQCLKLAKLHSIAIDFAKNGRKVDLNKDHTSLTQIKFPSYMPYPPDMSAHYKDSLKGKLYDSINIPEILKKNNYVWWRKNFCINRHNKYLRNRACYFWFFCDLCEISFNNHPDDSCYQRHIKENRHRQREILKARGMYELQKHDMRRNFPVNPSSKNFVSLPQHKPNPHERPQGRKQPDRGPPIGKNLQIRSINRAIKPEPEQTDQLKTEELATLSFQYLEDTSWVYCSKMELVLRLNGAWLNLKDKVEKEDVVLIYKKWVYNLSKKRRFGAHKPKPIRWGESDVLEASPTAEYVEDLYRTEKNPDLLREKVDKFCGFISKAQVPPPAPAQLQVDEQEHSSKSSNWSQPEKQVDQQMDNNTIYLDRPSPTRPAELRSVASSSNLSNLPSLPPVLHRGLSSSELYRSPSCPVVPNSPDWTQAWHYNHPQKRLSGSMQPMPAAPHFRSQYSRTRKQCQPVGDPFYDTVPTCDPHPSRRQMYNNHPYKHYTSGDIPRNFQNLNPYQADRLETPQSRHQPFPFLRNGDPERMLNYPLESEDALGSSGNMTCSRRSREDRF